MSAQHASLMAAAAPPPLSTTRSTFHCLDVCFSDADAVKYSKETVVRTTALARLCRPRPS